MSKKIKIGKKDNLLADVVDGVKNGYVLKCRDCSESPSVVGLMGYLVDSNMINCEIFIEVNLKERVSNGEIPFRAIRVISKRYGLSEKTVWNIWGRIKDK